MRLMLALSCLCLALAGCAVHPLPGDYTGVNTIDITNHIRCEARDAIELKAIDLLEKSETKNAHVIAARLKANRGLFRKFNRNELSDEKQKAFYDRYINTAIAYDFTLDMMETNTASTQLDFAKAFTGGVFSLGAGASNERTRQNIRKFQLVETFGKLLANKKLECNPMALAPDFIYPINGRIGLGEVINTFIDLNETESLQPKDAKGPVMADQLQFNTTFSGTLAPKVVLTPVAMPVGSRFRLADAALTANVARADRHQLIIGLSFPPAKDKAAPMGASIIGLGLVAKSVLSTREVTSAGYRASEAISQFRLDLFLDRGGPALLR